MATQSGVTVAGAGQPFTVASDIQRPKPGPKEVLLRTLAVGINPIEVTMQKTGLLVSSWPAVLGSEGCGIVLECGEGVSRLKVGDVVYGCGQLGRSAFLAFQDSFLAHEDLVLRTNGAITSVQACTVGANLETAALSLFAGADMTLPEPGVEAQARDEWVVVIGGSGNVGQYGVQLARLCGYKVLATCSPSKASLLGGKRGANATVDNRASEEDQVAKIREITGGSFIRVFDASAFGYNVAIKALEEASTGDKKLFTTVDSWSPHSTPSSITEYRTQLGLLGVVDNPVGAAVTEQVRGLIPRLEDYIEKGELKPLDHELVDGYGWDAVVEALARFESGKATKKLVIRVHAT